MWGGPHAHTTRSAICPRHPFRSQAHRPDPCPYRFSILTRRHVPGATKLSRGRVYPAQMPTADDARNSALKIGMEYLKRYYRPSQHIEIISKDQFKAILKSVCEAVKASYGGEALDATFEDRVKQMLEDKKAEVLGHHANGNGAVPRWRGCCRGGASASASGGGAASRSRCRTVSRTVPRAAPQRGDGHGGCCA